MSKSYDTKRELFLLGVEASKRFLDYNNLSPCKYHIVDWGDGPMADTGLYTWPGKIEVNLDVTALPRNKPVCSMRSFPGSKIDRTAFGVVAHETGHHVEFSLAKRRFFSMVGWKNAIIQGRKKVSGYEPNFHEAFAETMRVFILNPSLLQDAIPARYDYITNVLGLRPTVSLFWREVLPAAYHQDCLSWIAK